MRSAPLDAIPDRRQRHPEQPVAMLEMGPRMPAFEDGELLPQCENLQAEVVARAQETAEIDEKFGCQFRHWRAGTVKSGAEHGAADSAVRLAPVADTDNLDGAVAGLAKDDAPVADPKAVPRGLEAFQLLYVTGVGRQETGQGLEQPQCRLAINGSQVGSGFD